MRIFLTLIALLLMLTSCNLNKKTNQLIYNGLEGEILSVTKTNDDNTNYLLAIEFENKTQEAKTIELIDPEITLLNNRNENVKGNVRQDFTGEILPNEKQLVMYSFTYESAVKNAGFNLEGIKYTFNKMPIQQDELSINKDSNSLNGDTQNYNIKLEIKNNEYINAYGIDDSYSYLILDALSATYTNNTNDYLLIPHTRFLGTVNTKETQDIIGFIGLNKTIDEFNNNPYLDGYLLLSPNQQLTVDHPVSFPVGSSSTDWIEHNIIDFNLKYYITGHKVEMLNYQLNIDEVNLVEQHN